MKAEWDFHELIDFAGKLQNTYNLEVTLMTATQNVAKVLHQLLLENTPVDTGNLRKMWSAGDNLAFTVEKVNNGFQVTFINTARANDQNGFMYGIAVNDGHRTPSGKGWVMGRFFVEKSILQVSESKQIEAIVYKELQKWFEGCVNG